MAKRLSKDERRGDHSHHRSRSIYTPREFARIVGVSVQTLQRWDRQGRLVANRTLTNRRYYTDDDVARALGNALSASGRKTVAYCRVAHEAQRDDLIRQRRLIEQLCIDLGMTVDEWVEEIGSALDFKREQFQTLISRIIAGEIGVLAVVHHDRLMRFGMEVLERVCDHAGCTILSADNERFSPVGELAEDVNRIVSDAAQRLAGLRLIMPMHEDAVSSTSSPIAPLRKGAT